MTIYNNILVAVDDSKEAEMALHKAIEIGKSSHSLNLHIVTVIDTYSIAEDDVVALEREKRQAEKLLTSYKLIAENEGIELVDIHTTLGSPQTVISKEVAPLLKADLIVCGVQGLKNAEHFFLGSVSEGIVHSATSDVLIVRTD